jgi:hypothetical protein
LRGAKALPGIDVGQRSAAAQGERKQYDLSKKRIRLVDHRCPGASVGAMLMLLP